MCVLCWDSRRVWNGNTEETLPLAAEFGRKLKKRKQLTPQFYIRVLRILHSCTRAAHSTRLDSSMMQLTQKYDAVFHGRQDILYVFMSSSFIVVFFVRGRRFCLAWGALNYQKLGCHPQDVTVPPSPFRGGLSTQNGLAPFPLWGCRASIYGAFLEVIKFVDNLLWANASDGRFT